MTTDLHNRPRFRASQPWYLVGLPGSGKSKVGAILADVLRLPHIDIDQQIEEEQGTSVAQIFAERGEDAFRSLEAAAILQTAGHPGVISLGGGAVETEAVRDFLSRQTVIWIDADLPLLLARVQRNDRRPLMRDDPKGTLETLAERRNPIFERLADAHVHSSAGRPEKVVHQILRDLLGWDYASVRGTHAYPVISGSGTSVLLQNYLPAQATKAMIVVPSALEDRGRRLAAEMERFEITATVFVHPDGEVAKDLTVVAEAWDLLGRARLGRSDLVVTLGGGVTTDLGGFIAATWLRGIAVIHLPTTLLAMVDAAIGGKTGIDTTAGKNLVGAFYDPLAVLVDFDNIATLPPAEYVAGLAEVIKTGFIDDGEILRRVETNPQIGDIGWAAGAGQMVLAEIVRRAIAVKAKVVSGDRLESGLRETLNYGHTMGHAIERAEDYQMRHGEAVAIGAVFAAELAEALGAAVPGLAQRHRDVFASVGLPTSYRGDLDALLRAMTSDKKVRQGKLRFVLLEEPGRTVVTEVKADAVRNLAVALGMNRGVAPEGSTDE